MQNILILAGISITLLTIIIIAFYCYRIKCDVRDMNKTLSHQLFLPKYQTLCLH